MKESKYPELNDKAWLYQKYWVEGASLSQIAKIVNCSLSVVFDAFERQGIERRTVSAALSGERNPNYNKTFSEEHRKKLSEAKKGVCTKEKNSFYGHHHTKETKRKSSERQKGKHHSRETEFKKGNAPWNDGVRGERNSFFGKTHTEDARKRISEGKKGNKNPSKRQEVRDRISKTLKDHWLDPAFVAERIKERNTYPNKLETLVATILDELYPDEWKYNGNCEEGVVLAGMIPDFINVNGEKKVIEVFGTYWHSDEVIKGKWKRSEFGRKAAYSQLGYRCIVLWEDRINAEGMDYIKEEIKKK